MPRNTPWVRRRTDSEGVKKERLNSEREKPGNERQLEKGVAEQVQGIRAEIENEVVSDWD